MSTNNDADIMRQMQVAQADQMRKAQKQTPAKTAPTQAFSAILTNQNKTTSKKLQEQNPVGSSEVLRSAVTAGRSSKLAGGTATNGASTTSSASGDAVLNATGTSSTSSTGSTSDGQALLAATGKMQEMNQDFNLQYLGLQENMQAESRQYTAMSNVSKTKSDTAKNSLSNVK